VFGMGCFWGAERMFWREPGVVVTAAGYAGGDTAAPGYRQVCSGQTGHAEVVLVVFEPADVDYARLLQLFWEGHDPTQGMRQGNDVGSQYRSVIHCTSEAQHAAALASRDAYQARLSAAGRGTISTEIVYPAPPVHYAEPEHHQLRPTHHVGHRCLGLTGVRCALPAGA